MRKEKEVVRETISEESVLALEASRIKAVAFAEVGAQGNPEYVVLISDDGERVAIDEGSFGYEAFGRQHDGDVDIASVESAIPFLKLFRGMSLETTVRGHCRVNNEWIHLDARVGNHFFIRSELLDEFFATSEWPKHL